MSTSVTWDVSQNLLEWQVNQQNWRKTLKENVKWIRFLAWNPHKRRHHNCIQYNHSRSSGERISVFWGILDNIRRALQMGETQVQGRHGRVRAPPPLPDVLSSARMVAAPSSPLRGLGGSESRHRQPSLRYLAELRRSSAVVPCAVPPPTSPSWAGVTLGPIYP